MVCLGHRGRAWLYAALPRAGARRRDYQLETGAPGVGLGGRPGRGAPARRAQPGVGSAHEFAGPAVRLVALALHRAATDGRRRRLAGRTYGSLSTRAAQALTSGPGGPVT